ncbi:hypothetical protein DWX43_17105 [Clostridium sp. AF19-22AC]|jgi:hypothetical protein|uniref:hypothetical protein n=1 Tax=Clostridia TaxID=186801 RepID=UPI000E4BC130|nr:MULTISPECIES: hypothetical protein [Clostridia]RHR25842.1 hypothetical protein DWX43_17105 [Clostridium sp. AF19-22AC]
MTSLIDAIYQKTDLQYLSDMHDKRNWKTVLLSVEQIKETSYPKKDWIESYQYITGDYQIKSPGRSALMNRLRWGMYEERLNKTVVLSGTDDPAILHFKNKR